ncbi:MAG: pseudouridine synthase, partial [Candidatus Uhrbacteria bacterium]|nr:pseudouridine synthase [Candidatus Uhrbacteria bacterium]
LRPSGIVKQWVLKDERQNRVTAYDREVPGSQYAETSYCVLAEKDGRALIEVKPKTGRPHQIRVAMSSLGSPIVGDMKYGAAQAIALGSGSTALALFAKSLSFDQPVTKERITVSAEPDLDVFKKML